MSKVRVFFMAILAMALVVSFTVAVDDAQAKRKKSAAELEKAKKEGDATQEAAEKARAAFGREADEANIESFDTNTKKTGSGTSTYGVGGFDYLTGVGKIASDPTRIGGNIPESIQKSHGYPAKLVMNPEMRSPLEKLMKKRYKNKYTAQLGTAESGWAEKSGITEVWYRSMSSTSLGGDYNQWVNTWNNITRPRHGNKTPIPGTDPDQGAHWFSVYCIHCHGWTAKGDGPTAARLDPRPRNLTNGKYSNYISNVDMFAVVKGGGAARNLGEVMPPWGNIMQDQDIWNVVSFMRTLPQKEKYTMDPDDASSANAKNHAGFQEMNEMLELEGVMAGRGGGLVGGYSTVGGGRHVSSLVGVSTDKTSDSGSDSTGDAAFERTSLQNP